MQNSSGKEMQVQKVISIPIILGMVLVGSHGSLIGLSDVAEASYTCEDVNDDLHNLENMSSQHQLEVIQFAEECMANHSEYGVTVVHEEDSYFDGTNVIVPHEVCIYYVDLVVELFAFVCAESRAKAQVVDESNCGGVSSGNSCVAASGDSKGRTDFPPELVYGTTIGNFLYTFGDKTCHFGTAGTEALSCMVFFDTVFREVDWNDRCSRQHSYAEVDGDNFGTQDVESIADLPCNEVL